LLVFLNVLFIPTGNFKPRYSLVKFASNYRGEEGRLSSRGAPGRLPTRLTTLLLHPTRIALL